MRIKLLTIILNLLILGACSATSTEFQKDADIIRLNHLEHYGNLIEAYHEKTGKYPFQDKFQVPVYVHVANNEQIEYTKQGPPGAHEIVLFKLFIQELETQLGHDINEYYDPQYAPDYKPNFYIYMITGNTYFFAIHVHQSFPFAKKIADHYYKVELSNHANKKNMAVDPQLLFSNPEFKVEKNKPISKEAFFREREEKYLHYTKSIN